MPDELADGGMPERRYHQLKVWQEAMLLARRIYEATGRFPVGERDGLAAQLRRAAISIPTVIARGSERGGREQLIEHIEEARGTLAELETLWLLASQLGFARPDEALSEQVEQLSLKLNIYLKTSVKQ